MTFSSDLTRQRYNERVLKAVKFIHTNLECPLDLNTIADVANFSPYHFHRIFNAVIGETLNEYIRRKRLEMAVYRLVGARDMSITDIALSCGFSSSSNFSKAFSAYFACSPSAVRSPEKFEEHSKIGELKRKHGKDFDPRKLYPELINKQQETNMDVQIIEMKEKRISFLTSDKGYDTQTIYSMWDKLCGWAANNKLMNADAYGLCYDDPNITPTQKCRYEAALTVDEKTVIASPFKESVIPAGKYAMAYYRGPQDPEGKFHTRIYKEWFPQSGFEPDDFPLIERYLNDDREDDYCEMQIMIKIK